MRYLFVSLFCCLLSFQGFSQEGKSQLFRGFVTLGFNATQFDGDGLGGFRKLGGIGGAGVEFDLPKNFVGGIEFLYSMKGSRAPANVSEFKLNLDYIDLAFRAGYRFEGKFPGQLLVNLGLTPNLLIRYREKDATGSVQTGIPDEFRRMIFEVFGGVIYRYNQWGFNFRYNFSLLDQSKIAYSRNHYMTVKVLFYFL